LAAVQKQLSANGEVRIWLFARDGALIAASSSSIPTGPTGDLFQRLPGLRAATLDKTGNLIATDEQRDWLYSYVPVSGTNWAVAVGRPTDETFATVISFQHSLIIA